MTAKTEAEALAIEARRGDEHRAQIRAEGAEAMRELILEIIEGQMDGGLTADERVVVKTIADDIRSLSAPEPR